MTTFLFPGQGSQYIGMSKDFYDNFNNAKLVFDEVEDATSLPIKKIIFENSENQLNLTNFTQICIFTASYSIFKVIETEFDLSKLKVGFMLGHSLGEYTALVSSKKINLYECSKLLKIRGDLMNKSVEPNISGMAALIGLNNSAVQEIIDKEKLELQIANDNSLIQVVISGMNDRIESAKELFLNNGVKKFIKLNVSAAFHCNLMLNAQNTMKTYIRDTNFLKSDINIISNYSSKSSNKTEIIQDCLSNQIANKVRWTESIKELEIQKESNLIEIGPGKVLSGLVRRISSSFDIISIDQIKDLELLK